MPEKILQDLVTLLLGGYCCIALLGVVTAQGEIKVHANGVGTKCSKDFKLLLKIRNAKDLYAIFL